MGIFGRLIARVVHVLPGIDSIAAPDYSAQVPRLPAPNGAAAGSSAPQSGRTQPPTRSPLPTKSPALEPAAAILLGQTGSGKSTIINTLTNHYRGPTTLDPDDWSKLRVMIPTKYLDSTEHDAPSTEADPEDGRPPLSRIPMAREICGVEVQRVACQAPK
jgi:hypothetical protein